MERLDEISTEVREIVVWNASSYFAGGRGSPAIPVHPPRGLNQSSQGVGIGLVVGLELVVSNSSQIG